MAGRLTRYSLVLAVLAVLFSFFYAGWEDGSVVLLLLAALYAVFLVFWLLRRMGVRSEPRPRRRRDGWFGGDGGDGWGGGGGDGGGG